MHWRGQLTATRRIRLRRAAERDRPWLEDVHVAALGPIVLVGYGWTAERLRAQFRREVAVANCFVISVADGAERADAGYVSIEDRGAYWYIDAFAIAPNFQRRGIGEGTLRVVLEDAGTRPVRLSVLKTNRARSLYLRLGFRVIAGDTHREQMQWP